MLLVRFDDQTADRAAHLDKAPIVERDATGVQPSSNKPPLTGELHFDQVVAILRRRSSLILTIAGIGTLLAVVVGLLIPPKYTAMAQLVIEAPANSATERAPGVSALDESIDTHVTAQFSRPSPACHRKSVAEPGVPAGSAQHDRACADAWCQ